MGIRITPQEHPSKSNLFHSKPTLLTEQQCRTVGLRPILLETQLLSRTHSTNQPTSVASSLDDSVHRPFPNARRPVGQQLHFQAQGGGAARRIDPHGPPRRIVGVALGARRQHLVRHVISIAHHPVTIRIREQILVGPVGTVDIVATPGITTLPENGGQLEAAQRIAGYAGCRTTKGQHRNAWCWSQYAWKHIWASRLLHAFLGGSELAEQLQPGIPA